MITLRDVYEKNHPLTKYENAILTSAVIAVITAIVVVILLICLLTSSGLKEVTDTFFTVNAVSAALLIWMFLIISMFLSGVRFIRRHNKAVQNGMPYHGRVIAHRRLFIGARSGTRHKYRVQLDDGTVVKTPVYYDVPDLFRSCKVYYYKGKYYFSDFKW